MTELERLLLQDDFCLVSVASVKRALEQELFINKPCISKDVCEHDKNAVIDKIRAEIKELDIFYDSDHFSSNKDAMFKCNDILQILDKCEGENEENNGYLSCWMRNHRNICRNIKQNKYYVG